MDRIKWKIGLPFTDLKRLGVLLLLSLFYVLSPLQAKAGTWTSVGPYGGNIEDFAISPNYAVDQTLFAGAYAGGVFKSTDGGGSWSAVNSGLSNLYVLSLSISPSYATDQTLFAGTDGGDVFKSTDGGGSWSAVNTGLMSGSFVFSISFSPAYATDQTIFVGHISNGGNGVLKSADGGDSWSAVNTGLSNLSVSFLSISPGYATDQTIFAGTGGGVYKSTDGGGSWSAVNTGLSNLTVQSLSISPNYATDQTIFVGTYGDGIFKSTDGGGSWVAVNTGLSNLTVQSLSISPNYATDQTIFVGTYGDGIFKSTDGGGNWVAVNTGLSSLHVRSLSLSPGYATDQTIFAGTLGGGVFKSTDDGGSWVAVNTGLSSLSVSFLSISPTYATDQTIFVGTSDGVFKSTDGGGSWSAVNMLSGSVSFSPGYATDQTIFAGTGGGVYKSTDGGGSWSAVNTGLGNLEVSSLSISPNYATDQTIFAGIGDWFGIGSGGVFKSTDGGVNWIAVNTGLSGSVSSLSISPSYGTDQTIFAGTFDYLSGSKGVYKSNDGGGSWVAVDTGLSNLSVSFLSISPSYATDQTIFAGTNDFVSGSRGVFKSTDGGGSWSAVNMGLSSGWVSSLSISPSYATDQTIFAGTGGGVYKSTDGGGSWSAVNTGLGNLEVSSLSISPGYAIDQTLFAGTYGSSVWKYTDSVVASKLGNISTRGPVRTGDSVMIGGFIIEGTAPRSVLIRGFGPTLADWGVAGAMSNPYIELYSGQTMIATNDNWQTPIIQCDAPAVSCGTPQDIQATGKSACSVATTGCSQDAAILVTLPPGAYTAIMRGVGGGTGVGLIGVDDNDTSTLSKLVNISTRGPVLTGDSVMIGGFIIDAASGSKQVLIRGFGPTLADWGVTGAMSNPYIELYSGQTMIATNDNWQTAITKCDAPAISCGTPQDIQATGKDACSVATTGCSQDAAILVTLPPGAYTAIMRGVSGGTGVGLVGIDEIGP